MVKIYMEKLSLALLVALVFVSFVGCGEDSKMPRVPKSTIDSVSVTQNHVSVSPTIKVYVENSGSMDGYVKGATDFENAVYSYLSDIQHADLGVRTDSLATKNTLVLNYINSEVLQQRPDVKEFIEALEPADFKIKGGKRGISDMSNIIDTIISHTADNDVSILVSDCIFSPGKKYKDKDNADEYIVAQQIGIKSHIVEKLAESPNFSIIVLRLTSQFRGIYYNKFDDKQLINNERPFFMWLMGDRDYLNNILRKVNLNQIKGGGVKNMFMISKPLTVIPYSISLPQPGNGKYEIARIEKNTITNAKTEGRGVDCRFQIGILVNFSSLLLPDEYLMNPNNYSVSSKAYGIEITKYSGSNSQKGYTHMIKLNLLQPVVSKGSVKISLLNTFPQWIDDYTDESGLDINAPCAMEKTYGLKHLLGGVYDAYASNGQYGSITINIK